MKYENILAIQKELENAQTQFAQISFEYYIKLNHEIVEKLQLPNGQFIKYKVGTNTNSNVIDDCVSFDDGFASLTVAIMIEDHKHEIQFGIRKIKDGFIEVKTEINQKIFKYTVDVISIGKSENFKPIVDFIGNSLYELYKEGIELFKLF